MNEQTTFKTPSRLMAAVIVCTLLALFSISYLAPFLNVSWLNPAGKPSEALQQNMLMLLVLGVGYYIGSSKGSADNGDAIRQQLDKATPPAASVIAAPVKIDDSTPIAVAVEDPLVDRSKT